MRSSSGRSSGSTRTSGACVRPLVIESAADTVAGRTRKHLLTDVCAKLGVSVEAVEAKAAELARR